MAKIYRSTDRIQIKIGDIVCKFAPLTFEQKNEVQAMLVEGQKKFDLVLLNKGIMLAISYCLKSIDNIEDSNGEPYKLEFDGNKLTDECVNELLNMEDSPALIKVCSTIVNGIPKKFDIEGVELLETEKKTQATT